MKVAQSVNMNDMSAAKQPVETVETLQARIRELEAAMNLPDQQQQQQQHQHQQQHQQPQQRREQEQRQPQRQQQASAAGASIQELQVIGIGTDGILAQLKVLHSNVDR